MVGEFVAHDSPTIWSLNHGSAAISTGRYAPESRLVVLNLSSWSFDPGRPTSGRAYNLVASIEVGSFWREERKSDRQPYPGRRPTIALACASIETRPLASIGTCSRTRDLSCVTSAVAIAVSIGARLGAAIVVDQ